ncbi:hypothetical protein CY35_05G092100 [Sphagnum magellanicum]|nr:hypothetical protein CY35_05G092100 [Sphagnum magellanicum]
MTFPFSFLSEATSLVWLECSLYSWRSCNKIKLLITVVSTSSSSHCSSSSCLQQSTGKPNNLDLEIAEELNGHSMCLHVSYLT